jgi:hypothetical protein
MPRSSSASCARVPAGSPPGVIDTGDIESLTLMAELADTIDASIQDTVTGLRACGYSWAEIGSRLGVTRQAAQQRWGNRS